jgi:CubicO group peptidase (beta-lactamase class C family)
MYPDHAPHALPGTLAVLRQGMADGLHIGAQGCVWRAGKTIAEFAIGEARPGVPMTAETVMLWLSACKPIGAVAIAQLIERGHLDLDDPVAHVIPEFGVKGKEAITVRHILTHTAGFRWAETGWPIATWEQIIQRLSDAPLEREWVPGQKAGYHPNTSWFILGEIVRRIDGRPYEQYVRDEIFLPLGMRDSWIGMPEPERQRYEAAGRLELPWQTDRQPARPLAPWDRPDAWTHCRPAANGCGTTRDLLRFYQMLLNHGELDGARLLAPDTVRLFTTRQRIGMFDHSFQHVIDFGLGFIINSSRYGPDTVPYGFGPYASDDTFGHNGFQSTSAFCDPAHELIVIIIPNGMPGEAAHERRLRAVLGAVYSDLGIVS